MNMSVVWPGPGQEGVTIESREIPSAGPGELKMQVEASGLCGTDLHIASGEYPLARPSVIIGHEFAGTIVEVGPSGPESLGVGDRVVVVAATAEHAPESSDRLVGYLLQAFASAAAGELPPPATPQRMYRALARHRPG